MPRPLKCRRICSMPKINAFVPDGDSPDEMRDFIVMNMDEYETIRLIDSLGMTQEQCALQMEVARSTVTNIYNSARKKIAEMLVNGRRLVLEGGNYRLCDRKPKHCKGHGCCTGFTSGSFEKNTNEDN